MEELDDLSIFKVTKEKNASLEVYKNHRGFLS
jgi:hypothetical protein